MMKIKEVHFVKSSTDIKDCPTDISKPEYAFIGRSNVGKSSLINYLTNRKKIAKISSTPGKTKLINHFLIDNAWFLVDLPGYGWAKASKEDKKTWEKVFKKYLLKCQSLANVFLLIDSRHLPQKIDLTMIQWLGNQQIPFCIVFTKTDKLSKHEVTENINIYKKKLLETWKGLPIFFITSSKQKSGSHDILSFINEVNTSIC